MGSLTVPEPSIVVLLAWQQSRLDREERLGHRGVVWVENRPTLVRVPGTMQFRLVEQ